MAGCLLKNLYNTVAGLLVVNAGMPDCLEKVSRT
jgi:hypothetical protein